MDDSRDDDARGMDLGSLGLQAGLMLKAQPLDERGAELDLQFLGILEGKGVLVEPLGVQALKLGLRSDAAFVVRGFTGRYDFSFATKVMRVFDFSFREPPLAYALLAYPVHVDARLVRCAWTSARSRCPRARTAASRWSSAI